MTHRAATAMGVLLKHKCPNNPQLLEENQMPLATGVQTLTCIGWLDMLAHGFEFGGGRGGLWVV